MQYPKSVRKELRSLASTAYERELDSALEDIYAGFEKWKNKQIDCFGLNQLKPSIWIGIWNRGR